MRAIKIFGVWGKYLHRNTVRHVTKAAGKLTYKLVTLHSETSCLFHMLWLFCIAY